MASVEVAVQLLEQLEAVLKSESEALRTLDAAGIEAAAASKDELNEKLAPCLVELRARALEPAARERVEALRSRVVELMQSNLRRLEATAGSIRELVHALAGSDPTTYGPKNRARSYAVAGVGQAILTAEVG